MERSGKHATVELYSRHEELMHFGTYHYFILLGDCTRTFFCSHGLLATFISDLKISLCQTMNNYDIVTS